MRWSALVTAFVAGAVVLTGCLEQSERSFRVPSAAMEPTIHCAKPGYGCL